MPRKSRDKGDNFSPEVREAIRANRQGEAVGAIVSVDPAANFIEAGHIANALAELLSHPDGYLKIDPTESGTTYYKWRFNKLKWSGHYVMAVCHYKVDLFCGLTILAGKVEEVRSGQRTPTREDLGYFT